MTVMNCHSPIILGGIMSEEIRRGGLVITKTDEPITYMEDMANLAIFKKEILERLDKIEEDIKRLRQVKTK